MPDLTLYLGGTRSGKSLQAEQDAMLSGRHVLYVATAIPRSDDASMLERIRRHQARRPAQWRTLECPINLANRLDQAFATLPQYADKGVVLLDCVTVWMANILFHLPDPEDWEAFEKETYREVQALLELMERNSCHWILVSGETGLGGIHANAQGRYFCDGLGMVNQMLTAKAQKTWFCVAGKKLLLED